MADVKLYLTELEERRRRIRQRFRIALLIALAASVVALPLWLVFQSPVFMVGGIRVVGNHRIAPEVVIDFARSAIITDSAWARIFGPQHLFSWPARLSEREMRQFLNIRSLSIRKSFRERSVVITIEEREPFGIWCVRKMQPAECFWFEADGTVFDPAPDVEGKLIRVVSDYTTEHLDFGAPVLSSVLIPHLRDVLDVLATSDIAVKEVRYEDPALQELRVVTHDGPEIFFSLRFSPSFTIPVIASLYGKNRAGVLTPPLAAMQYIDFRVENRAYYK